MGQTRKILPAEHVNKSKLPTTTSIKKETHPHFDLSLCPINKIKNPKIVSILHQNLPLSANVTQPLRRDARYSRREENDLLRRFDSLHLIFSFDTLSDDATGCSRCIGPPTRRIACFPTARIEVDHYAGHIIPLLWTSDVLQEFCFRCYIIIVGSANRCRGYISLSD